MMAAIVSRSHKHIYSYHNCVFDDNISKELRHLSITFILQQIIRIYLYEFVKLQVRTEQGIVQIARFIYS